MPFVPSDLSNLALWLTPDTGVYTDDGRTTPVASDGDAVGGYSDQASTNHHVQSDSGRKPVYKTNVFPSGKPAIRTSGNPDKTCLSLTHANATAGLKACESGSHTAFFLVKLISDTSGFNSFYTKCSSNDFAFHFMLPTDSGSRIRRYNGMWTAPLNRGIHSFVDLDSWQIICHQWNNATNEESFWVGGKLISRAVQPYPFFSPDTTHDFRIGCTGDDNLGFNGDVGPIIIYGDVKTRKQVQQVFDYLSTWSGVPLNTDDGTIRIVVGGDSIAEGVGSTGELNGFSKQLIDKLGTDYEAVNFGRNGETVLTMSGAMAGNKFAPSRKPATRTIFLAEGGVNDLVGAGRTAAQLQSDYQTLCEAKRDTGGKVIAFTVHQNTFITGGVATEWLAFNTWLKANYTTFADRLVRIDEDSRISGPSEGLHPNDTQHGYWADLILAQISDLIPTTGFTVSGGASSGTVDEESAAFSIDLPSGEEFDGDSYITLTASDGVITVTAAGGTIVGNGTSTVEVLPASGETGFTFTYTAASAGSKTISYTNGQAWTNPAGSGFTATTSGPSGDMLVLQQKRLKLGVLG